MNDSRNSRGGQFSEQDVPLEELSIRQLMDACRPLSDDLDQPEMDRLANAMREDDEIRQQFERCQRLDREITAAYQDVAVPGGLSQRILDALDEAGAASEIATGEGASHDSRTDESVPRVPEEDPVSDDDRVAVRESATPRGQGRRWALAASIVAALTWIVFLLNPFPPAPVKPDQLADDVEQWLKSERLAVWSDAWQDDFSAPALERYQLDEPVQMGTRVGWQPLSTAYDEQAVVYRLQLRSETATLFVIRSQQPFAVPTNPLMKVPATGGWSIGVWQSDAKLFVLAVHGDQNDLHQFIRQQQFARIVERSRPLG